MTIQTLIPRMRQICGARNVITDPLELRTYECDGLTSHRATPALVVFPQTAQQVAAVVRGCAGAGVPFVARGSGTGLSGGAVPREDGVLIVLAKMRSVLEIDPVARRAVVEPGVTNLAVTQAAAPHGLFYAPDPSSQVVCSVGGNVAENSGGRALPQARLHRQSRDGRGGRHPVRRADVAGRRHRGATRIRPARRVHWL